MEGGVGVAPLPTLTPAMAASDVLVRSRELLRTASLDTATSLRTSLLLLTLGSIFAAAAPWPPRAAELPAWVISLRRTPKRYADFSADGAALRVFPRLERFDAIDGRELDVVNDERFAVSARVAVRRGSRRAHTDLATVGMAGLYISHVDVWTKCAASAGDDVCVVLEDDAVITPALAPRLDALLAALPSPDAWDVVVLGAVRVARSHAAPGLAPGLHVVDEYAGTQAYLVSRRGAARLLRLAYPMTTQVDAFMSQAAALGLVRALWPSAGDVALSVPQRLFAGTTVQERYCHLCDLGDDYNRFVDVARWMAVGAVAALALALGVAPRARRSCSAVGETSAGVGCRRARVAAAERCPRLGLHMWRRRRGAAGGGAGAADGDAGGDKADV